MTNLEKLKQKIYEICPDKVNKYGRCMTCGFGFDFCECVPKRKEWDDYEEISLHEVLRMLAISKPYACYKSLENPDTVLIVSDDIRIIWDLTKTLDEQKPETIEFLADLIIKK